MHSLLQVDPEAGRRDQSTSCTSTQKTFQLTFETDGYGYETSYKLEKRNANGSWKSVDSGPNDQKYKSRTEYNPKPLCLDGGDTYRLTMMDSGKDGLCCKYGKGKYQFALDGDVKYDSKYTNTFSQKATKTFVVPMPADVSLPISGRNSICGSGKQQLRIELKLDQFADQDNWWKLVDLDTKRVVKSVNKGDYAKNQKETIEVCLDDGKYQFTLFDNSGDGICCRSGSGYYKLFMDGDLMVDEQFFNTGKKQDHTIIVGYGKSLTLNTREREYLDAHNWRRRKAHKSANVDYAPLKWSKGLANHAQNWAEELLNDCDVVGIKHEPNVQQGENLAKNTGKGSWGSLYPVENIVRRWVEREEGWKWPSNAHLTQALWRSSNYVGCGESEKEMSNGGTCRIQVCRYARAGNCNMGKYNPKQNEGWKTPMLMTENPCGPACPPEGCF